jgi:hypothetical protein
MMAALLMITSMRGMSLSERMVAAVARTEERRERSTSMNFMMVEGEVAAIASRTGCARALERPRRMSMAG